MPETRPRVHFIGIGGIGMSGLARWFLAQKWAISGSDIAKGIISSKLIKEGVKLNFGHKKGNISPKISLVVYSQAITPTNPELQEARQLKLPCLSYPEAVGRLTKIYETIAVAGAHGKSTVTALLGLILDDAGLDPTVLVGTMLHEFGGKNFALGRGKYLVLEADEYGGAFLHYSPPLAVVTNIDREHLDFYKNLGRIKNVFLKFLSHVRVGGTLVLNRDDKNLYALKPRIARIVKARKLRIVWYTRRNPLYKKIKKIIRIPGQHNISNALAALTVAKILGIPQPTALRAIGDYRGSWRRLEYRGRYKGALVFDDYAHHPTEIKATLRSIKEKYPRKKILCVFQPHQAERLKLLFKEFQVAFADADTTLILPTYEVAGRDRTSNKFNAEALVWAIQKKEPKKLIFYLKNPKNLKAAINTLDGSLGKKIIVMMGAGDIVSYTDSLIR